MANQVGISIVIKAFLQTGKSLDEQFNALSAVKTAHETGDYSALLKLATVEEVKTESKTRRVEDQPQTAQEPAASGTTETAEAEPETTSEPETVAAVDDADVPEFLKKDKKQKAA